MHYLSNAKPGDKVFGLVQGHLTIKSIVPEKYRIPGAAAITCENSKGKQFHYSMEGQPMWAFNYCDCRTLYRLEDVDLSDLDMATSPKLLSEKRIKKLLAKDKLQLRVPSGLWMDTDIIPKHLVDKALNNLHWHLFKEK